MQVFTGEGVNLSFLEFEKIFGEVKSQEDADKIAFDLVRKYHTDESKNSQDYDPEDHEDHDDHEIFVAKIHPNADDPIAEYFIGLLWKVNEKCKYHVFSRHFEIPILKHNGYTPNDYVFMTFAKGEKDIIAKCDLEIYLSKLKK